MPLVACLLWAHCVTASGTAWSLWHWMQAWLSLELEDESFAMSDAEGFCAHADAADNAANAKTKTSG
jgi:hypothetical protein